MIARETPVDFFSMFRKILQSGFMARTIFRNAPHT